MKIKLEYVNDDWMRLYVNGLVVMENHSLLLQSVLEELQEREVIKLEVTHVTEDC